jgi:hypothetical protein
MYEPPSPWFLFIIYQLMRRRGMRRKKGNTRCFMPPAMDSITSLSCGFNLFAAGF